MDKQRSKVMMIMVVVAGILFFLSTHNGQAAEKRELKKFEIGGGSMGGAYYVTANAFADLFRRKLGMDIPFTASATEGSAENVRLLDGRRIEGGKIAASALFLAWNGQKPYEKKYRNLRMVMRVFPNPTVFFALEGRNITRISDLKGKRVGCGVGRATWDVLTKPFLEAHGIDYEKDIKRVYGSFEDLCNQVRDGLLDTAIGNVSGGMNLLPAIAALAAQKKLVFLEWDPKAIDRLSAEIPYHNKVVVKAAALPGRQSDYATVDIGSKQFVLRDDIPEELAYRITKVIHENLGELADTVKIFEYIKQNPTFMTQRLGDVEFHSGSVRYWKEAGLWKN